MNERCSCKWHQKEATGRSSINGESAGAREAGVRVDLPAAGRERRRLEANSRSSCQGFVYLEHCQFRHAANYVIFVLIIIQLPKSTWPGLKAKMILINTTSSVDVNASLIFYDFDRPMRNCASRHFSRLIALIVALFMCSFSLTNLSYFLC